MSMRSESSVENQIEWIEYCESRGSYDGENGVAIRKADLDELERRVLKEGSRHHEFLNVRRNLKTE